MPVLIRIAFRNLLEHKAKSLIIGILLALGVVILIVGNSFMDTAAKGVRDTFLANYTGDVFVSAKAKTPISLFGAQSTGQRESTPVLTPYDEILEQVRSQPAVTGVTSQVTSFALVSTRGSDKQGFALLFGIEPESYRRLFTGAKVVEGGFLEPGEEGIVVSRKMLKNWEKMAKLTPKVGDQLLLTGMGKGGIKIRAVTLRGVVEYGTESEATDFISYADADTVRILSGLTVGSDPDSAPSAAQLELLSASDDDFFGEETIVAAGELGGAKAEAVIPAAAAPAAKAAAPEADRGSWHFVLARMDRPSQAPAAIAALNLHFAQNGIEAVAGDWKAAAGPFAQSIDVIRIVFNIAIIIVAVVAVIIMMNTLVISVIERTGEIGTMRALGAQKGFVRKMFLAETLTIAAVFGLIGMALAFAIIGALSAAGIEATNPFLKILFAGNVLRPTIVPSSVVWSMALVALVAVAAHLYPVSLALKIQPVRAMQAE